MNYSVQHLQPLRLPENNDAQGYLRAQFERGGVNKEGDQRMGKIAEYANRAQNAAWSLLHADKADERSVLRASIVDSISKEETARELFANGSVHPAVVLERVDQRLRIMTRAGLTQEDQAIFEKGYAVIGAYVQGQTGRLKEGTGTGLPKPRASR